MTYTAIMIGCEFFISFICLTDTAFTTLKLEAHTDGTYLREPPGLQVIEYVYYCAHEISPCLLQIFHCLQAAAVGGETILVDGFNVAARLKAQNPDAYDFLSEVEIPFFFYEPHKRDLRTKHRVFEHEGTYVH
jgi:trimethyllysine dioxygenase